MLRLTFVAILVCATAALACERKPTAPPAPAHNHDAPAPTSTAPTAPPAAGHHRDPIALGQATVGDLTVRASRDAGEIKPAGDAPIDVWLTTADGQPATVSAVRLWIGTEDAKGSVKARADIEDPAQPNHWHTHAEVPDPLPEGSRLWVEIERPDGAKTAASFDLAR